MPAKTSSSKVTPLKKTEKKTLKADNIQKNKEVKNTTAIAILAEWVQDASIEVPVPVNTPYKEGQRQLEFSVGLRQHEDGDIIRSELRARALVHVEGQVLAMVEASYVALQEPQEMRPELPQYLYSQLKPHLDNLFTISGHTPPLPEKLEDAA